VDEIVAGTGGSYDSADPFGTGMLGDGG